MNNSDTNASDAGKGAPNNTSSAPPPPTPNAWARSTWGGTTWARRSSAPSTEGAR